MQIGESSTRTWPGHVIWCDLTWWWSFGAKAPAVSPGFVQRCCNYEQSNDVSLPGMLNSKGSFFQLRTADQCSSMLIFATHKLIKLAQNPAKSHFRPIPRLTPEISGPSALGEPLRYADRGAGSNMNSWWWSQNGSEEVMMHRDAPISNPPIENASLKIENLCRNSDTKELRKLTLVRFLACVLQERFLGVRPGRREVQGDLEEWGGMSTVGYNLNREDSGYIDAEWRGYKWIFIYIYLYIEW